MIIDCIYVFVLQLNYFAWSIIESRGKKLNQARIPGVTEEEKHLTSEQAKEAALA